MNDVTAHDAIAADAPAATAQVTPAVAPPARGNLRPLLTLMPFVKRYKGRAALAFVALVVASLATLAVPIAVRRMIDLGFSAERIELIDQYFTGMIAVVAVLALASGARYYLVTT